MARKTSTHNVSERIHAGRITSDMTFSQKVLALTARIPRGHVATYGQIAAALGSGAFRAVGLALNHNPYAPAVPCHRVVGADGRLVGYAGGLAKKQSLIRREGVQVSDGKVDLSRFRCDL